ncbi:MAG: basic secretory protein-like protein [candidate division WOR-3 bacterium]
MVLFLLSQWSFGQNKVDYKDLKWKVLDSEHFKVYHYQGGEKLAEFSVYVLEEAYKEFKDYLPGALKEGEKIPVIIYISPKDFQQTNVSPYIVPEGVGGFTEGFKRRVVVPFAGDYYEFRHVLRHELVHALQFGYSRGLTGLISYSQPPQWFIEGMAEYIAQKWDLRTEVYMRDLVVNLRLPSLEEMGYYYGYISYRYGQAFFKFLEDVYGERAVRDFIRMGMSGNIERALKSITGKDPDEISEEFSMYIKSKVMRVLGEYDFPRDIKRLSRRKDNSYMNVGASISPDGSLVAFISDRRGRMGIWVLNLATRELKLLQEGERTPDFENLHVLKPSLSISSDKKLAVISQGTFSDILSIYDLKRFKRIAKYELRGLDGAHGGEISPDGKRFVFVGYKDGVPDIYLLDLENKTLRNLTNDEFSDNDPSWYDDSTIVFVSDRNEKGEIGSYAIFKMTLTGKRERVFGYMRFLKKPKRIGDGIVFISEYKGSANLFKLKGDSAYILTNYFSEIQDYDVAENGRWVMSMLWEGGWDVFLSTEFPKEKLVVELKGEEGIIVRKDEDVQMVKEPLGFTLGLDFAYGGFSYSSFYGTVGSLIMMFSDIPGDNWIILQLLGQSQYIENSEFMINYYNFKGRLDKGLNFYQLYFYRYYQPYFVIEKRFGLDVFGAYPFNRFFRLESGISSYYNTWIKFHQDSFEYYCGITTSLFCIYPKFEYPKGYEGFLSFVYDDVLLSQYGSTDGIRWLFTASSSLPLSQVENRWIQFVGMFFRSIGTRTTWANLFIGAKSFGKNGNVYTAGGPYGLRGYDLYYFFYDKDKLVRALIGNNYVQYTSEIRFPFIDRLKFGFLPLEIRNLRALAFLDVGNAWFSNDEVLKENYERLYPMVLHLFGKDYNVFADVGFGIRFNVFYIPIRLDWAFPFNNEGIYSPVLNISFGWDF